jgi:hypothetical protein
VAPATSGLKGEISPASRVLRDEETPSFSSHGNYCTVRGNPAWGFKIFS